MWSAEEDNVPEIRGVTPWAHLSHRARFETSPHICRTPGGSYYHL